MLNYRLEPLGVVEGFTAEVGASGSFCPSHLTLPVDVSFYSVSDDNAPSPYMVRVFSTFFDQSFALVYFLTFLRVCVYASSIFKQFFMLLQGVINLESLGKRGYRVPPSGTIQVVREPFVFFSYFTNVDIHY